jgi:DNA polymerase elongation subunit (family B)
VSNGECQAPAVSLFDRNEEKSELQQYVGDFVLQSGCSYNLKQLALKILINAGYGVFASRYFKYYDPRVAELITAYGIYILTKKCRTLPKVWVLKLYIVILILCSFLHYQNINTDSFLNVEGIALRGSTKNAVSI